ncbi:unnamed protein product [Heterobilharzia americana]|nr:unnamed protein product [Heterobilharzia americana]
MTSICHRDTQRSYIRDPQTNCISSRKLSIRKCSGSCDSTVIHQQQQQLLNSNFNDQESIKYYKWRKVYKRSANSAQVWLPDNSKDMRSFRTIKDLSTIVSQHSDHSSSFTSQQYCCQATKMKLKPILFNCPNGAVYERTIKLARKCSCVQCVQQMTKTH